jgi:predicted kinase
MSTHFPNTPTLLLTTGLPGTGKTTFARALAERIGAAHLNTDILRAEMGLQGQYDQAAKSKVYQALEQRTAQLLAQGRTVVVDGTFYLRKLRQAYQALAEERGCPIHWFVLEAPEEAVKQRVSQKREYSEADFEVYQKIKAQWEPFEEGEAVNIPTGPLGQMVETALTYLPS